MYLNPAKFNAHIRHMGQDVSWRKAYVCPCKSADSGASDPKCPNCAGKGQLWNAAAVGVVGVTGSKVQKEWAQFGNYESGDTVVTIGSDSPLYRMGQFDRVTLLNAPEEFSVALIHGANTERLIGKIVSVDRVFWLNEQKAIVEGGTPTVDEDGRLAWATGEPAVGAQFTISGVKLQEFFCWGQFPSNRNEHQGALLPKRVVLRKFDLWGRPKE